mmetsp:Transcript_920/g.1553  ORF Transcript_920/g.1553 Transcript_920/m.1553 type:complete len:226 (+) Transcript_920:363-1040(+)
MPPTEGATAGATAPPRPSGFRCSRRALIGHILLDLRRASTQPGPKVVQMSPIDRVVQFAFCLPRHHIGIQHVHPMHSVPQLGVPIPQQVISPTISAATTMVRTMMTCIIIITTTTTSTFSFFSEECVVVITIITRWCPNATARIVNRSATDGAHRTGTTTTTSSAQVGSHASATKYVSTWQWDGSTILTRDGNTHNSRQQWLFLVQRRSKTIIIPTTTFFFICCC